MDNNQVLKVITPVKCPECGKNIYICQQQIPAGIAWALEEGAIKQAKDDVRKVVNEIKDEEEKNGLLGWLDDENTVFGPDDVANIVDQLNNKSNVNKSNVNK